MTWGDGEIRGLRTAAAVAAAVEEATAETEARLVRALTDASPDQLRALETAIRAVRGESPIPSPRGRRDASASLVDAGVGPATPATDEKESRSAVRSQSNRVAADEEAAMGYPFTVEAALRRFGPRPSSPIRADAVVAAAADAAAEAAKLGPTAQEMYYASYKAAMDAAVGALDAHDASATMAAAAARRARLDPARSTTDTSEASTRFPPSRSAARRSTRLSAPRDLCREVASGPCSRGDARRRRRRRVPRSIKSRATIRTDTR